MLAEIKNCSQQINFKPEIVYPGEYFVIGSCSPMEKVTKSKQLVKVQINGNGDNELAAKCLEVNCPLMKKSE